MSHDFSWSVSRHDSFHSCRRKYYYSYYAATEDPEIHRLKKLSALPLWAGSLVHETIETFLKTRDEIPSETEQQAMIHAAVHGQMLSDWRESEAGSLRFRLFEHEYQVPVDKEDKKIVVGIVMRSLRAFFRCRALQEAFAVGRERWLTVEDLVSFTVDGVTVLARMDLAYRSAEGRVVIVDWKTGRNEGRFAETQLAGYALYAVEQGWVKEPEEIQTELAYLAVPRFVRRSVDRQRVEAARNFIRKSAGTMKELLLDPVANLARLEDFAMVDRPRICRRCNYRRLCFPRPEEVMGPALTPAPAPAG
jgi:CRISPR/Cas system-associated exonuclease Cas4 (RecB family)